MFVKFEKHLLQICWSCASITCSACIYLFSSYVYGGHFFRFWPLVRSHQSLLLNVVSIKRSWILYCLVKAQNSIISVDWCVL